MTKVDLGELESLPRRNGELVFETPWEARAFGVAVALCREQELDWDEFRGRLVAEIGAWESGDEWSYYARWLAALERLALDRGLLTEAEVAARMERLAHDDDHDHDHRHLFGAQCH